MTSVFAHAAASFEPTATSVLLWTRLGGGVTSTRWVVASDRRFEDVVAAGEAATDAGRDFTVVVDVDGLEPATTYWYRFVAGGETSPAGRTRTLPGAGAERLRFATVSCARYSVAPLGVYRAVAERDVDLVVHLGDYIYEDEGSKGPRDHDPPHAAVTVDDYRRRLAQIRRDPDAQALHLRHPIVAIWDDHDLADNAWRGGAKHHDPEEQGPWDERVRAAARARQEWLPARLRDPEDPLLTWRSVGVGDLAELVLLDTRLTGRDLHAGDEGSLDLHDPNRSLLGDAQRAWLRERLSDTTCTWTVLATGVVMNEVELRWPRPLRWIAHLLPNGYAVLDGRLLHDDQWDGYPAERDRVAGWIRDRADAGGSTVVLSADIHSSWAFEGPVEPGNGRPVAVEMTTPAVSSAAMGRAHYPGMWRLLDAEADRLDHVRWADVTERGYGVVDLDRDAVTMEWWFVHPYAQDPAADAEPGAAFRWRREVWPPRLEEVDLPTPERLPAADREDLPPRPADLRRLRIRRTTRIAAEAMSAATPLVVAAAAVVRRRTRARSGR